MSNTNMIIWTQIWTKNTEKYTWYDPIFIIYKKRPSCTMEIKVRTVGTIVKAETER